MSFNDWALGVQHGLGVPLWVASLDAEWAWANAESFDPRIPLPVESQLMKWNNPLNSTLVWPGSKNSPAQPSRPVQIYATVQDGIDATIATLQNGNFPNIVADLRAGLSRDQWGNAIAELRLWGTGPAWLGQPYPGGPSPTDILGGTMTPDQKLDFLLNDVIGSNIDSPGGNLALIVAAVKATLAKVNTLAPGGTTDLTPVLTLLGQVKTELDSIKAGVVPVDLTALSQTLANVQTIVTTIEAQLKAGLKAA